MSGYIHHISITCRDITLSKNYYGLFNFSPYRCFEDDEVIILWLKNNNGIIELFHFKISGAEPLPTKSLNNYGITHLALKTPSLLAMRRLLEQQGYRCQESKTARICGFRYFFTADPDGNLVEVIEEN